ncbi:MAG TPA: hypothetical protein VM555_05505 [Tahibacter sp.]|nr:hypothetical protein [Tahibacter sp.]
MIRHIVLLLLCVVTSGVQAAAPPERFDVTFVSVLPEGGFKRETRPLRADEIAAMGVFRSSANAARDADDGAPRRPNEPINGTVSDDLMRVDYHLQRNGWIRDTSYGRTLPGGPWQLISDSLRRAAGGGGSGGIGGDCPPGAGDNCVDLN